MPKDPYRYFRTEAREILEQLGRGVLDLEEGVQGGDLVGRLLRLMHTLKGAAHVVKQAAIADLAHRMEDVLAPYAASGAVPKTETGALLALIDQLEDRMGALNIAGSAEAPSPASGQTPPAPVSRHSPTVAAPAALPYQDEVFDTVRVDLHDMDGLLQRIAETGVRLAELKLKLGAVEHAVDLAGLVLSQWPTRLGDGDKRAANALSKARSVAEDLNAWLRPLGHELAGDVGQVERELAQVRDTATQLRLVPVSAAFAPLRRMARDTAQSLEKQAEFVATGGEHRLDAHILAAVRDALLQIVRNAVAHGIERPAERLAAGKAAQGRIVLQVQRRGDRIAFTCQDDGRGFDLAAVRRAAVAAGLLEEAEAEAQSTEELFRVLLTGGLSTSAGVTQMAGRGLGLGVVRELASRLKAEISLRTDPGHGSTVEILVPVSLLSLSAVMVESGGVKVSFPLDAVERTLRLSGNEITRSPAGERIVLDGKSVPFVRLETVLSSAKGSVRERPGAISAVVVRAGAQHAVIGVDALRGTATVLLRPIPAFAGVHPVVAGAALDAQGNPQLVLDPGALLAVAAESGLDTDQPVPPRTPLLLVVDDSLTTRMLEQSILESAGYKVHLATSAEEALQKARECTYDLFLVDVEMPGMDGFEFVAHARSRPELAEVPSILVTSRSSEKDRARGRAVGACAYFVKSEFDQSQLLQTIRQLVS